MESQYKCHAGPYKNINKYKKQFVDADVLFICNKDSKKNIDLSLGFEI